MSVVSIKESLTSPGETQSHSQVSAKPSCIQTIGAKAIILETDLEWV